jgi:hypothetical protein
MVRRFCPPRHFAARCARLWWAACALGVAVVAIGGCGVDRTGLQQVQLPDDAGNGTMVRGDAPADRTSVDGTGGQSGIDGVGGGAGDGGAASGGGGAGTGGAIGTGGVIGTGGMIGTGGAIGTGGMIGTGGIGTGGGPGDGLGDGGPGGTPPGDGGVNGTGGVGDAGATTGTGGRGGAGGGPGAGCTPATCTNGCCAGATCITSLSAQQCGHGGGACQPCAPCDRCSVAGTCELDPTSLWDLWAVSAALNPIDPNIKAPASTTWDLDSGEVGGTLPDPFVELDILAQPVTTLGHTATIVDALFPNWTGLPTATQALLNPVAPLTASDLMGGRQWQIVVGDDDVGVASATSGETMCQIDGPLVPADFRNGTFTRIGVDSCFSATFRLTCHL